MENRFRPLDYLPTSASQSILKSQQFYEQARRRRTVREFSQTAVPAEIIENCILAAGTAPSGANQQPWHFAVVSEPEVKKHIREAAEAEEREFYESRASDEWLTALKPFGTDANKPFLEIAPWLIAVFCQRHGIADDGSQIKHYYPTESVGIATGLLVTAIHHAGLVSLTHTPSPMGFLNQLLKRPANERPFVLLAVGYPADDAKVPVINRKPLSDIASYF